MPEKRIICAALTGNWGSKKDNPALPVTPEEIADAAYEAYCEGAAVVHVHMRDEHELPTMNVDRFRYCIELIRSRCDIIINLTSSGDHTFETIGAYDVRCAPFAELKPEMGSFDCGSMNWMHTTIFENHPMFLEMLGAVMIEAGVKQEIEIFDTGMMGTALHYIKNGVIKEPSHFQFVLGCPGGIDATVENLAFLHRRLPEGATWSATGIGSSHIPILLTTLALGGHLRVGLEDNLFYEKGVLAKSNGQLVGRAREIMRLVGMEPATPDEAREMLGIRSK